MVLSSLVPQGPRALPTPLPRSRSLWKRTLQRKAEGARWGVKAVLTPAEEVLEKAQEEEGEEVVLKKTKSGWEEVVAPKTKNKVLEKTKVQWMPKAQDLEKSKGKDSKKSKGKPVWLAQRPGSPRGSERQEQLRAGNAAPEVPGGLALVCAVSQTREESAGGHGQASTGREAVVLPDFLGAMW